MALVACEECGSEISDRAAACPRCGHPRARRRRRVGWLPILALLIALPELTWAGRDLLDTMKSKPVWEKMKALAREKGIELSFDAVKSLGKIALDMVLKG